MEGDHIKINRWLLPFSWLYGLAVIIRNELFELNSLKTRRFDIPVISVGNITVGGSGKTPHVEYLIRLLKDKMKVAVLSRGYKRKSRGYVLAGNNTPMREIGDEPYQMKIKFPNIRVAVDKKRCEGIDRLTTDEETKDTDVILLDDAFQHRYVQPGINILLVDYHRLIIYDKLLPAGRLREPLSGKHRADIVIITKCPDALNPIDYRVLSKAMELYPFQQLYFTKLEYCPLEPIFHKGLSIPLTEIRGKNVLLLTGIASPRQLETDINAYTARLMGIETLSDDVKDNIYALPIKVRFMLDKEETFNKKIISYVRKNSRNSILVKREDEHKTQDGNHSGNRPRTISFRDN